MSTLKTPLRGHEDEGPPGENTTVHFVSEHVVTYITDKCKCSGGRVKVLLVAGVLLGDGHLAHPELHYGVIQLDHRGADISCGAEKLMLIEEINSFAITIFEDVKYRAVCSPTKIDSVTLGVGKWTTGAKPDLCQVFRVSGEA